MRGMVTDISINIKILFLPRIADGTLSYRLYPSDCWTWSIREASLNFSGIVRCSVYIDTCMLHTPIFILFNT